MKYQIISMIIAISMSAAAYAVDLNQGNVCNNGKCYEYLTTVDTQKFIATPKWADLTTPPPLSATQAVTSAKQYAVKAFAELHQQPKVGRIDLRRHAFSQFGANGPDFSDNWYYIISFALPFGSAIQTPGEVVVLMDGSVVPPTVKKTK